MPLINSAAANGGVVSPLSAMLFVALQLTGTLILLPLVHQSLKHKLNLPTHTSVLEAQVESSYTHISP
jgi:hypothetical protein